MALPRHSGQNDETVTDPGLPARAKLLVAAFGVVLIAVVVLHLTGVVGG